MYNACYTDCCNEDKGLSHFSIIYYFIYVPSLLDAFSCKYVSLRLRLCTFTIYYYV